MACGEPPKSLVFQERPPQGRPFVARLRIAWNAAGSFDVTFDDRAPFALRPPLAMLLAALAADNSHHPTTSDPFVGFKTTQVLVHAIGAQLQRLVTRDRLTRWIRRLRAVLDRQVPNGGALIQARAGAGWRLARLRSPLAPPEGCRRKE